MEKVGPANYVVDMAGKSRRRRNFHVNMLKEWYNQQAPALYVAESDAESVENIPLWNDAGSSGPVISEQLGVEQRRTIHNVVQEFHDVFSDNPGRTTLTEHRIETGSKRIIDPWSGSTG